MPLTLVKDVLHRVSVQLHDVSPQFTRWTQRELVSNLNDGQKAIAKYLPSSCSRVDSIRLVPGTKQSIERILAANIIPGDGSTPADVYGNVIQTVTRNMGAAGATPGRAIRIIDREILDVNSPDWHAATGTPISAYAYDPRMPKIFYVTPGVPPATQWWAEVSFLADPVEVSQVGTYTFDGADTTAISIDDKYVDDLVNYILARAFMKDSEFAANPQMAQSYTALFTGSINAMAVAMTGVNPNLQSLPMNPNVPARKG